MTNAVVSWVSVTPVTDLAECAIKWRCEK